MECIVVGTRSSSSDGFQTCFKLCGITCEIDITHVINVKNHLCVCTRDPLQTAVLAFANLHDCDIVPFSTLDSPFPLPHLDMRCFEVSSGNAVSTSSLNSKPAFSLV